MQVSSQLSVGEKFGTGVLTEFCFANGWLFVVEREARRGGWVQKRLVSLQFGEGV